MQRFDQLVFGVSLVVLSWLGMMAVHEVGHVMGGFATGGVVERVVLHPLAISQTDVSPNPHPAIVVWLGPVVGCLLPLITWVIVPRRWSAMRTSVQFFAGFCLIANGGYIAIGSWDGVGDCGEMLRTGTPQWVMLAFGAVSIVGGLFLWHALGSLKQFVSEPSRVTPWMAYWLCGALGVVVALECVLSS